MIALIGLCGCRFDKDPLYREAELGRDIVPKKLGWNGKAGKRSTAGRRIDHTFRASRLAFIYFIMHLQLGVWSQVSHPRSIGLARGPLLYSTSAASMRFLERLEHSGREHEQ